VTTLTELRAIAALAMIGLSISPVSVVTNSLRLRHVRLV
jgi:cation transport ATPase